MLRIDILTIFPDIFTGVFSESILKRANAKGLAEYHLHNLRDFGIGRHQQVDDTAYGGGAGMVMMCAPIVEAIESLTAQRQYDEIIYMSPDGERLDQAACNHMSLHQNLMIICGRYKGIDQRIRDNWITKEISIGDYVLTGGELPAAVLVDSLVRLIPGVLNDESSALSDSFQANLLDAPVYTKPSDFRGYKVPDVLLGGDHRCIEEWRLNTSYEKTASRRPDLLNNDSE